MPPCLPSAISGARHQHIVSTNNSTTSSSSSFSFSTITRTYVFLARDIEDQPSSRSKPPAEKIDMTSVRRSAVRHLQIAWTPRCHGPALLTSRASSQNTRQPWSIHLLSRPHHFFSLPIIVLRRLCRCSFVAHLYTSRQRYSVDFLESLVGIVQNLHPPPELKAFLRSALYTAVFEQRPTRSRAAQILFVPGEISSTIIILIGTVAQRWRAQPLGGSQPPTLTCTRHIVVHHSRLTLVSVSVSVSTPTPTLTPTPTPTPTPSLLLPLLPLASPSPCTHRPRRQIPKPPSRYAGRFHTCPCPHVD